MLALIPVLLAAIVYQPLVGAYFYQDDFLNLFQIANLDPLQYLLRPHGGHVLVTRNALFYLTERAFGPSPAPFFWVVLATHLLNVHLLFRVIRHLTDSGHLASFGAALWGICPVHAGTLGWYSVYGQVVVCTLLLVILTQAAALARDGRQVPSSALLVWPVLLILASTSFGVGIGLAMVAPVALFLLLPASARRGPVCAVLAILAAALPFLYQGMLALYDRIAGPSIEVIAASILFASFDHPERIVVMLGLLLSHGLTHLLAGFAAMDASLPGSVVLGVTASFGALVLVALTWSRPTPRRALVALLILSLASYGMIAIGRSVFIKIITVGQAAVQQRYHYVATMPLPIVVTILLAELGRSLRLGTGTKNLLLAGWATVAMGLYAIAPPFIDLHADARVETGSVIAAVRSAAAAAPAGSGVRIRNRPFRSVGPMLLLAPVGFPGWAAVFIAFFPANVVDGRRIYFEVDDSGVLAGNARGRRTADLLVPFPRVEPPAPPSGAASTGTGGDR